MSKRPRAALDTVAEEKPPAPLPRWLLPLIIAVYVALTALLIFRVPLNTAPDEGAHFDYVAYVAQHGQPPVFQNVQAPGAGYEFYQPPLYYFVCAPLWRLTSGDTQRHACRLVSLCCGAAMLWLLWQSALALFPAARSLPAWATGFAALWPLHQQVGAMANNDGMNSLCCTAMFWVVARGARRGWQTSDAVWLGGFFGLAMLTKSSSLAVGIAGLGAAWMLAAQQHRERPEALKPLFAVAIVLGVTVLLSGWWLARNQLLYGDPLAQTALQKTFTGVGVPPQAFLDAGVPLGTYLADAALILFCGVWGIFGSPNAAIAMLRPFFGKGIRPEGLVMLPFMVLCAAATLLAGYGLAKYARTWRDEPAAVRVAVGWWMVGAVLVGLVLLRFNLMIFQAQARYLHPAFAPLALGFAAGWRRAWGHAAGAANAHGPAPSRAWPLWVASGLGGALLLTLTLWNALSWRVLS